MKVAVIGGGLTGLAAAYYLSRQDGAWDIQLLEAAPRFGGLLYSEYQDGFWIEGGPDSMISQKPQALDLCLELGLADELIHSPDTGSRPFVITRQGEYAIPRNLLRHPQTALRSLAEAGLLSRPDSAPPAVRPEEPATDESVAAFVRRRFGARALEVVFEPMLAGIYGGEVETLSARSTLPQFFSSDPEAPAGAWSPPGFISLRRGMGRLGDALVGALEGRAQLTPSCPVQKIVERPGGYRLEFDSGDSLETDRIILATPATVSSAVLESVDPELNRLLAEIPYTSSLVICLGYSDTPFAGRGPGFLVARDMRRRIVAGTFLSNKFPHRYRRGSMLRCFAAGRHADELMAMEKSAVAALACEETARLTGCREMPDLVRIFAWPASMPQYVVGHKERREQILEAQAARPSLQLAGNYLDGVGLADAVRQARRASDALSQSI